MTPSTNSQTKTIWVLPLRDQSGDETTIENGESRKLSDVIDVTTLPKNIVIGIPEEVVQRYINDSEVIFAQFVRQPERERSIYVLSVRDGRDVSGRIVFFTILRLFPLDQFSIHLPEELALPTTERQISASLNQRIQNGIDSWAESVNAMAIAVRNNPRIMSFANVDMDQSYFKAEWSPKKRTLTVKMIAVAVGVIGLLGLILASHFLSQSVHKK